MVGTHFSNILFLSLDFFEIQKLFNCENSSGVEIE